MPVYHLESLTDHRDANINKKIDVVYDTIKVDLQA
jgi:hypothetical protein